LTFGRFDVAAVMACYAATLGLLVVAGAMAGLGWAFDAGVAVAAGIAIHHYRLIRDRTREGCFKAFLHNNWFGAAVFAGVVAALVGR
jgi:4-hydroxybenzoate polyprenyltransferase